MLSVWQRSIPLLTTLLLFGCSDRVSELFDNDPPPGVKVVFGQGLIVANTKVASASNNEAALLIELTVDNDSKHMMSVSSKQAWIDWKDLGITTGSHLYEISIFYPGSEPLLIAQGRQRTTYIAINFTESMLKVTPYDVDGNGDVSADERRLLDTDEDGMANLAEIIVGGNPNNARPSFLSAERITLVERQNLGTDYVFDYIPIAISPRLGDDGNLARVSYRILSVVPPVGGPDAPFILDNASGKLLLSGSDLGKPWPSYVPGNIENNTYTIIFEANDGTRTSTLDLAIEITDRLNLTVAIDVKTLNFSWDAVNDSNGNPAYYTLLENPDGNAGFVEVAGAGRINLTSFAQDIAVHFFDRLNAQYRLEAYDSQDDTLISKSDNFFITDSVIEAIGYVKSIDTQTDNEFGYSVDLSADGSTLVVGAPGTNTSAEAVYLYTRLIDNNTGNPVGPWSFSVSLIAPYALIAGFGSNVSISGDGRILAVGAILENNGANSPMEFNLQCNQNVLLAGCSASSGAVYVFVRPNGGWTSWSASNNSTHITYLKAPNAGFKDNFGWRVALSNDAAVLAVSAMRENNAADGTMTDPADTCNDDATKNTIKACAIDSGAVYVFERPITGGWSAWASDANKVITYLKAPNADDFDRFGWSLALSADAAVLAVGADQEDNNASGTLDIGAADVCSDSTIAGCAVDSGVVYLFERPTTGAWSNWASSNQIITYLKSTNAGPGDRFGISLSISNDGAVLAVGAPTEDNAKDGTMDENSQCIETGPLCAVDAGAVYVFERPAIAGWSSWSSETNSRAVYLKAPNAGANDYFGISLSLTNNGGLLAVGSISEDNAAGGSMDNSAQCINLGSLCAVDSGAVYIYRRPDTVVWSDWTSNNNITTTYIKAPNAGADDSFGRSLSLSGDGRVLAIGAPSEDSDLQYNVSAPIAAIPSERINGVLQPTINDNMPAAGAVYLY